MHKKYYIDILENGKINIVKVLNEYKTVEEAKKELFELISEEKKEKDLLKDYSKKNIL